MLINGEKWACEACVRGHRVSNCQHADRPLQHINKKGRPVSQCQHCRALRKSRSAHTKCDCGEKSHKCAHMKATVEGHKESCCCNHGGRCTCAHKKEILHLTPVFESDTENDAAPQPKGSKGPVRSRRRANTVHLDGVLSFDENGHHKPAHKHPKTSQKCGPYQLNRVNSVRSAGASSHSSVDGDNSPLNGPHSADSGATNSPLDTSDLLQDRSQINSGDASPLMTGSANFADLHGQLQPLDLSSIEYPPFLPNSYDNIFGSLSEHEQPLFSAGLSATPVDWSHYDGLDFASRADDLAPSNYSQPQSFGTFDFNGSEQPTLTTNTSTSGEASEIEDFLPNSVDDFEDAAFGTRTASTGFNVAQMQANLLGNTDVAAVSYEDFKLLKAGNKFLPTPTSLVAEDTVLAAASSGGVANFLVDDDTALWMNDYAHGLPGISSLADSPDPTVPNFWEAS